MACERLERRRRVSSPRRREKVEWRTASVEAMEAKRPAPVSQRIAPSGIALVRLSNWGGDGTAAAVASRMSSIGERGGFFQE
jgi:hypothetical protein